MARTPKEDEEIVDAGFIDKVRKTLGRVPFSSEAVASYFCASDPDTPRSVKITIMAALAYFVVPTDMVPDFIAGLGFTDDAAVFWAAWRSIQGHIKDNHREQADAFLLNNDETPHT